MMRLTNARKLVVLLDPHNYARYYGTDIIGGTNVSGADFADFWRRMALEFKDDPYVWFGLVNEPHNLPTQQWFDTTMCGWGGPGGPLGRAGTNSISSTSSPRTGNGAAYFLIVVAI
jgi:hypothetical protein